MTSRERFLVVTTLTVAGFGGMLFGAVRLIESRASALDAGASLIECRKLAAQIAANRGSITSSEARNAPRESDVIRRVESAARSADLPADRIDRIEPGPVRRVGDGRAHEKPTNVQLTGVTLRQTFTFLHAVGAGRSGLHLRQIHLSAPSPDDTGENWSVESTLAYPVVAEEGAVTE